LILALALSFVVLFGWSAFVGKPSQKAGISPVVRIAGQNNEPSLVSPENPPPALKEENIEFGQFEYQNNNSKVIFSEPSATIKEITFNKYNNYKLSLKAGLSIGDPKWEFIRQSVGNNEVTYAYSDKEKTIVKRFIFDNTKYSTTLEINVQNKTKANLSIQIPITLGVLNIAANAQLNPQDVIVSTKEKNFYPNIKRAKTFNNLKFIGLREKYFCAIIQPLDMDYSGGLVKINPNETEVRVLSSVYQIASGQTIDLKFNAFLGPQDLKIIGSNNKDWQAIIYYGTFDVIAQVMLKMLEFLFGLVHNWGWAIIILSFIIYIILYPLTLQQMRSMKVMQAIQPQMEELKKQYKDNPQRLNKEMIELYRTNKVNPLGGCLPLILQIPIFFALYQVLTRSIALKGAHFLWIRDLAAPDRLFILPNSLPLLGNEINILPLLMAGIMFFQQKSSMSKMGGAGAEQQKILLIIMPVMFGFLFYRMPSGLVLYWSINSVFTLIYQLKTVKAK